jgi:hypothetical protein
MYFWPVVLIFSALDLNRTLRGGELVRFLGGGLGPVRGNLEVLRTGVEGRRVF